MDITFQLLPLTLDHQVRTVGIHSGLRLCGGALKQHIELLLLMQDAFLAVEQRLESCLDRLYCMSGANPDHGDSRSDLAHVCASNPA
ncbi:hypothetical protein ATN89_02035 [Comamonas thiooxydans]|nr:hypothetical protein ATN89_02035 [Comamonas thiooxydans]